MSLQKDLQATSGLEAAYRKGLQAIRALDRERVIAKSPRRLRGSADIDTALSDRYPHENRWDYVIACKTGSNGERLHWIEVHPANGDRFISEVGDKLSWLKGWLAKEGKRLHRKDARFVWIASGATGFRAGSQQTKRIANKGILFAGGRYRLDN